MSIAELRERIELNKKQLEEDTEKKRIGKLKEKEEFNDMLMMEARKI